MTPRHRKVLQALDETTLSGEYCVFFKHVATHAQMDVKEVRRVIRHLARKGYASYERGLMNEYTGMLCGSGYCITKAGREALL